jgi:hypothetical protein
MHHLYGAGWDWKKGTGLVAFYFLPPETPKASVPSASVLGSGFFTSEEDAVAWAIGEATETD